MKKRYSLGLLAFLTGLAWSGVIYTAAQPDTYVLNNVPPLPVATHHGKILGEVRIANLCADCGDTGGSGGGGSVIPSGPLITTTSLPPAYVGQTYSYQMQASGGTAPYIWGITSSNIPCCSTSMSVGGVFGTTYTLTRSGTATISGPAGIYSATFKVTDALGQTATKALSFQIVDSSAPALPDFYSSFGDISPKISSTAVAVNTSVLAKFTVYNGGAQAYAPSTEIQYVGNMLPASTDYNIPENTCAGLAYLGQNQSCVVALKASYSSPGTNYGIKLILDPHNNQAEVSKDNNWALLSFDVQSLPPSLTIATSSIPSALVGTAYSQYIGFTYTGDKSCLTTTVTGLPAGMVLDGAGSTPPNQNRCVAPANKYFSISGTPTQSGTYSLSIYMTDNFGVSDAKYLSLIVNPTVSPTPTASFSVKDNGVLQPNNFTAVVGDTLTYNWSATNATNGTMLVSVSPADSCSPQTPTSPSLWPSFPGSGSQTSGSISAVVGSCQAGHTYTLTYFSSYAVKGFPGVDSEHKTIVINVTDKATMLMNTTVSIPNGIVGQPYSATFTYSYSGPWALNAHVTGLPSGLHGNGLASDPNNVLGLLPGVPGSTLIISGTPSQAGTYNVQVVFEDQHGSSVTKTYSVVIGSTSTPSIKVTQPNGGEVWHPGETHRISWSATGLKKVLLYLYDDHVFGSGSTNTISNTSGIDMGVDAAQGYYDWIVPSLCNLPPLTSACPGSANFKVRVDGFTTDSVGYSSGSNSFTYYEPVIRDSSDAPFSIISGTAAPSHGPGTLINLNGTVYLVGNGKLYGIPNLDVFNSWGWSFANVLPAAGGDATLPVSGVVPMRPAGQAIPTNGADLIALIESLLGSTNPSPSVAAKLNPASPVSAQVSVNPSTYVLMAKIDLTATTTDVYIDTLILGTNNSVSNFSAINVMDNNTLVGSLNNMAVYSWNNGQYYYYQAIPVKLSIAKNTTHTLNLLGILSSGSSGSTVKLGLVGVEFANYHFAQWTQIFGNPMTIVGGTDLNYNLTLPSITGPSSVTPGSSNLYSAVSKGLDFATHPTYWINYTFDWGDGSSKDSKTIESGYSVYHIYQSNGVYTLTVTANDSNGHSSSSSKMITVGTSIISDVPHAVGTNVIDSQTVWFISPDGTRRAYTSAGAFLSYGFNSWGQVVPANSADLALPAGAFVPPQDGSLINDKGTIYLITNGQRIGFANSYAFLGMGYSYQNAIPADTSFMPALEPINSANQTHPDGTLVNDNGTVYLIQMRSDFYRIGIPSNDVFASWGYNYRNIVPANGYDDAKPVWGLLNYRQPGELSPRTSSVTQVGP